MRIYFAGDHAGFELKKDLMEFVKGLGHEVEDLGPLTYDAQDDYPDFVIPLAKKVASYSPFSKGSTREGEGFKSSDLADSATSFKKGGTENEVRGILTAASGQGEVVAANRIKGVRAVVYYGGTLDVVYKTREHNDANVLSVGARFASFQESKEAVRIFLETPFSKEERHIRRLKKIESMTNF